MQFDVNEWRKIYDKVQFLGQIIKDSCESMDDDKKWVPALYPISRETRRSLEAEIKDLMGSNNIYLDACGMRSHPPLWKYDKEDPSTWASHESFKFKHLLNVRRYRCTNGYQLSQRLG